MDKRTLLTAARLREVLHYNPQTGAFNWIVPWKWGRQKNKTGSIQTLATGYKRFVIHIDGRHYRGSRLAWLYMTGKWPLAVIDHINGNSLDNRWCNLRDVPRGENQLNLHGRRRNNTSGYRGVVRLRVYKPWIARIGGKHLGYFRTKLEAHLAVEKYLKHSS